MRFLSASIIFGACVAAIPVAAAPGDRQFTVVANHSPAALLTAVRAGADFVKGGRGRQFRVILANAGIISVVPGMSTIQREVYNLRRGAGGLTIVACKETIDALAKANKRSIPVIPGVSVSKCGGLRNQMTKSGWQVAPGLGF